MNELDNTYEAMMTYLKTAEEEIDAFLIGNDISDHLESLSQLSLLFDDLNAQLSDELHALNDNGSKSNSSIGNQSIDSSREMNAAQSTPIVNSPPTFETQVSVSLSAASTCSIKSIGSTLEVDNEVIVVDRTETIKPVADDKEELIANQAIELLTASQLQHLKQQMAITTTSENGTKCENYASLFGGHISAINRRWMGRALPPFIEKCFLYLVTNGINSVGIFRKSGVKSRTVYLRERAEAGEEISFSDYSVADIADIVKTWLRELKPSLIGSDLIKAFAKDWSDVQRHILSLPDAHRILLQVVLRFLALVASNSDLNQMTAHNLAICLAPSLCECTAEQLFDAQKVLEKCINNCEPLFNILCSTHVPDDLKRLKHEASVVCEAPPQDILYRILYERQLIDPTITSWRARNETASSDEFSLKRKSSEFSQSKKVTFSRLWHLNTTDKSAHVTESGALHQAKWTIRPNGSDTSLVIHQVASDLRGHSYQFYERTFPEIHVAQLINLRNSFLSPNFDTLPSATSNNSTTKTELIGSLADSRYLVENHRWPSIGEVFCCKKRRGKPKLPPLHAANYLSCPETRI